MSQEISKLLSEQTYPDGAFEQASQSIIGMPHRVRVKGLQGVDATVIVTVVQAKIWLSVSPPFTWEAIMEPGKVDELMYVLKLAQEEAEQMTAARGEHAPAGKPAVPVITSGQVSRSGQ